MKRPSKLILVWDVIIKPAYYLSFSILQLCLLLVGKVVICFIDFYQWKEWWWAVTEVYSLSRTYWAPWHHRDWFIFNCVWVEPVLLFIFWWKIYQTWVYNFWVCKHCLVDPFFHRLLLKFELLLQQGFPLVQWMLELKMLGQQLGRCLMLPFALRYQQMHCHLWKNQNNL